MPLVISWLRRFSAIDARVPGEPRVAGDLDPGGKRRVSHAAGIRGARAADPGRDVRVVVLDPAPPVPAAARSRGSAPPGAAGTNASTAGCRRRCRVHRDRSRFTCCISVSSSSGGGPLPGDLRPRAAAGRMVLDIPPDCGARARSSKKPSFAVGSSGRSSGSGVRRRPSSSALPSSLSPTEFPIPVGVYFPVGVLLGGVVLVTRSLWASVLLHATHNLQSLVLAFAFPTTLEANAAFAATGAGGRGGGRSS